MNFEVSIGDPDHEALCSRIDHILAMSNIVPEVVVRRDATLNRQTQEELMKLCEQAHHTRRGLVYWQFAFYQVPKPDRAFVAGWLLKRFASEVNSSLRSSIDTVFLNQRGMILSEFADEVIRLLNDPSYGDCRSGMIYYLARLKHSQAAELIASVMDEGQLAWSALRGLGDLKAKQYEARVRKYLREPDSEIRLEAKRALKKMGCDVGKSPPIHLVKGRKSVPKGLKEWSANLDFESLEPVLKSLASCVHDGFGSQEVAEVLSVTEETKPEHTKTFRFPINGGMSELWVSVFMDDIDCPDLYVHSDPELIKKFATNVELGR